MVEEAKTTAAQDLAQAQNTGVATGGPSYGTVNVLMNVINFIMILWLIYSLVDIFGQDTSQIHVAATCNPWSAPPGGSDCEKCGKDGLLGKKIHWANISGEYKRDLFDYMRLCVPCHKRYDLERINLRAL